MNSRRQLLLTACALVAATSPVAQPSARMRVVGVLGNSGTDLFRFFVAALAELGWIEGKTVTFVYRGRTRVMKLLPSERASSSP